MTQLQAMLEAAGQPLEWSGVPQNLVYACTGSGYCVSVAVGGTHANATCDGQCKPLAAAQWLANAEYWTQASQGVIKAKTATVLKKSTMQSQLLPPTQKVYVSAGAQCTIDSPQQFQGYWICTYLSL